MNISLNISAKQVGESIIQFSQDKAAVMQTWADSDVRPNGLSEVECVGFTSLQDESLQILTDLLAPQAEDAALLRLWVIASGLDDQGAERFDNVQLTFSVKGDAVRITADKGAAVSRDDLKTLLQQDTTQLVRMTLSDQTGVVEATGERLGVRYDITDADDPSIVAAEAALPQVASRLLAQS